MISDQDESHASVDGVELFNDHRARLPASYCLQTWTLVFLPETSPSPARSPLPSIGAVLALQA